MFTITIPQLPRESDQAKQTQHIQQFCHKAASGFIQAILNKIQGLLKASPTVFKD